MVLDVMKQQHRKGKSEYKLYRDNPKNKLERQHKAVPENRIVLHQTPEVIETDKAAFTTGKRIVKIRKPGPHHIEKWAHQNDEEEDDGRDQ